MGKPKKKPRLSAKTADIHDLYQRSVQDPPTDVKFINRAFRKKRGRKPQVLREDFCGTALMCADWVRKKPERTAYGLDLSQPTLDWGMRHNIEPLGDDKSRVKLINQNVLDPVDFRADAALAFNFSYCIFKERSELLAYCRSVRECLVDDGAFFLDIHGGSDNGDVLTEPTKHKGFTYVWDQQPFDPIKGHGVRYIHFRFPDGSKIKKAFTYDWRLWSLPELLDILTEAGFSSVDTFWEGATKKGEGNGVFKRKTHAEQEESWIAYVVGWR